MFEGIDEARLRRVIRENEGVKYQVYKDSLGKTSAGIGHLMPDDVLPEGHAVSPEMVEAWFEADLSGAYDGARRIAGGAWSGMSEPRREALIDFVYQCGAGGALKFRRCVRAIRDHAWAAAAVEHLDSKGARQVPGRFMRRAKIFAYGSYGGE